METEAALDNLNALRTIVDPCRVRLLGLLLARSMAVEDLAASLDLSSAAVAHHVQRLFEAGFIGQESGAGPMRYSAQVNRLHEVARFLTGMGTAPGATGGTFDGAAGPEIDYEGKVLRAFLKGGRLVTIPAQEKKKDVLLRYLATHCFLEGRDYTEKEVNELLSAYHEDVTSLRRYMVVAGLLSRQAGVYRRERQSAMCSNAPARS